ncbi:ribosome maturation factor [Buchnera aphidicola (Nipponaphis monzeni)]|uniref:Ribosome maturation factor RimM n=1 Tax=Buchnera aphidicola (Nipponaphis monzeni) TaxID=2495405 RepID=A0A455TAG2_9GAMM|nr:ribosome maturation factor RimM [Buchnera aphidicola]BBI01313.1 ribosome maturation factor [Buchnera aphidicola (Nipponaphis monzeni)]
MNLIKNSNKNINQKMLLVGIITNPYGILGWLKLYSYTTIKLNIFNYFPWYHIINNNKFVIHVKNWKTYKKNFLIKISNVTNRSEAERFAKCKILIDMQTLPKLKKNQYYWKDIQNCCVINYDRSILGYVNKIISTPSNDILIIKNINQYQFKQKEILIPFIINTFIKKVDIYKKIIQVNLENFL